MIKITLKPLEGIEIEGKGSVLFGQTKAEVEKLLPNPEIVEETQLHYDELELRIDLNAQNKVEFIEFFGPDCEFIEPSIYGVNPFTTPAKQLCKLLEGKNSGKIDDTEAPYSYAYLGNSVGVWRDLTEADAKEEIEQAKKDGEYEDWMEEELEKSKFFWTIGIGEKDYYKY